MAPGNKIKDFTQTIYYNTDNQRCRWSHPIKYLEETTVTIKSAPTLKRVSCKRDHSNNLSVIRHCRWSLSKIHSRDQNHYNTVFGRYRWSLSIKSIEETILHYNAGINGYRWSHASKYIDETTTSIILCSKVVESLMQKNI